MDLKLTRKIALVTGSAAGIGLAIAKSFASEGARVYVNGRTQKRVDAAMAAIRSKAPNAKLDGIAADFSSSAGAETVIAKLPAVDIGEQCRHFRTKAICGNSRCRLVPFFRNKRNERCAALATLSSWDAETQLGPHPFHVE